METAKQSSIYKSKYLQMLKGGTNYTMIRSVIFGKVHGHGVREIWLISQFPAKHTGVASGAKIVIALPGQARLLGYGYGVINLTMGAIHSTKISGNFGPKLNGSVRSNRESFEKTVQFSRSDWSEFWLNGSRSMSSSSI